MSVPSLDAAFAMELRVLTEGLEPGMYLTRLDRPWKDVGFALDGWMLRTDDEVERVRALCRHVHVDVLRGKAPDARFVVLDDDDVPADDGLAVDVVEPGAEHGVALRMAAWCAGEDEGAPLEPVVREEADGWSSVVASAAVDPTERAPVTESRRGERAARDVFGEGLDVARNAHARLNAGIRDALDSARQGIGIDVVELETGVDGMLDSLGRHPGAMAWVLAMEDKGEYLYRHGLACAIWAGTFGRHLGLESFELHELALGALLCDVGKVRLPSELLLKVGPLDANELRHLRAHVEESRSIVTEAGGFSFAVAQMVAQHHERHDGSGYPRGLRGPNIALAARIIGLVDSYDAMTSDRGYATRRSPHEAMMELYQLRDRHFEGALVQQFIRTCGVFPTGTLVELSDGTVGVVMRVHSLKRLRPTVMLLLGPDKRPLADFVALDLAVTERDARGEPLNVASSLQLGAYGLDPAQLFLD